MVQKPFAYDLCLVDRLEQLVNSEYTADVFFKVGEAGEPMFAHKNVITTASEVLYAQHNGQFHDAISNSRDNPIAVKDISPVVFLEILRFMYCERVNFTDEIFVELYYAAKKYLLSKLVDVCDKYIEGEIKEDNVLKIFNDNRRYEFDDINTVCLRVICDNPLECFEQERFLKMEKSSLKLILESPKINCLEDHLENATQRWLECNVNGQTTSKDFLYLAVRRSGRELLCQKLYAFSAFRYADEILTDMFVDVYQSFNLYGFGIFIGTKSQNINSVNLYVEIIAEDGNHKLDEKRTVPVNGELYVFEMFFKKIILQKDNRYQIVVKLDAYVEPLSEMFHLDYFQPVGNTWNTLMMLTYTTDIKQNCLAHMLYSKQ
uniref:BTB/POZ domain-containing protein 6 n=1 Tax=Culex pipiens TaxID=7175 RepID=A0A8D8H739_CULPI